MDSGSAENGGDGEDDKASWAARTRTEGKGKQQQQEVYMYLLFLACDPPDLLTWTQHTEQYSTLVQGSQKQMDGHSRLAEEKLYTFS